MHTDASTTPATEMPAPSESRWRYEPCCESHTAFDSVPAQSTGIRPSMHIVDDEMLPDPEAATEVENAERILSQSKPEQSHSSDHASEHMQAQENSPLFCLPPEIRNKIYERIFNCRDDQCTWDDVHDCPQINLLNANGNAPSNEPIIACRRMYSESRGIFVKAQREYWSNTTFTLSFKVAEPNIRLADCVVFPEPLHSEQARCISRVIIDIFVDTTLTIVATLTPNTYLGAESWTVKRTPKYESRWTHALDSLRSLLPLKQRCHLDCRQLLRFEKVREKVRRVMWDTYMSRRPDFDGRRIGCTCIVCDGYTSTGGWSDRRADLMVVVAWLCETFTMRLGSCAQRGGYVL